MPATVPTSAEFAALAARVATLEHGPTPPIPPFVPSPAWTTIPTAASITMNDGGKVEVTASKSLQLTPLGGVAAPMGTTTNVVETLIDAAGAIIHRSADVPGAYWKWTAPNWASCPNPWPVVPPVPGTGPRAKLISYLQSVTGKQCLIGQTSKQDLGDYDAVTAAFGFSPAMMVVDPWITQWAGNAPYDTSFMPRALAHAQGGDIVAMSMILPNPVDHGPTQGGPAVDPIALMQAGTPLNASLNGMLDQAAGLLQQFKAIGVAVPVRYMLELDGGWFWWGVGHFSNAQQTQLFRYITNYLRVTKGLGDHILPTFAVNAGPGTYQYPGDDVVDIAGIDCYTDDLAARYKPHYDKLVALAPSKLFALTEYGSGDPNGPDTNYDLTRLKGDIQSALPKTCYANFWSGWGPNLQRNGKAAMSDLFWLNKGQVQV